MKFEFHIKRAPTSENPLQTVARRTGMAAEQKGRKREIATGAVKSIEGIIMVRGKVKEKTRDLYTQPGAVALHHVVSVVILWSGRACRVDRAENKFNRPMMWM